MSNVSEITNHSRNNKRLRFVRIIFALSMLLGVMSCFLDWEMVQIDRQATEHSNYRMVVGAIAHGIYLESVDLGLTSISTTPWFTTLIVDRAIHFSLLCLFISPLFLARTFSYSRVLLILWVCTFIAWHILLGYLHQKYSPYVFITEVGGGRLESHAHVSYLSGFYTACTAFGLHLLASLILLTARHPCSEILSNLETTKN